MVRFGIDNMMSRMPWLGSWRGFQGTGMGNTTSYTGRVYLTPIWVFQDMDVDGMYTNFAASYATYGTIIIGLYTDGTAAQGNDPEGGLLLYETATLSLLTGGIVGMMSATGIPLKKGVYWAALETANSTAAFLYYYPRPYWADYGTEKLGGAYYAKAVYGTLAVICPAVTLLTAANWVVMIHAVPRSG